MSRNASIFIAQVKTAMHFAGFGLAYHIPVHEALKFVHAELAAAWDLKRKPKPKPRIRAPGAGRPRSDSARCPCGLMTVARARARSHKCEAPLSQYMKAQLETGRQALIEAEKRRELYPCARCDSDQWICIHCDKALSACHCKDNGARNPAPCPVCNGGVVIGEDARTIGGTFTG